MARPLRPLQTMLPLTNPFGPDNREYPRWLVAVGSKTLEALFCSEAVVARSVCAGVRSASTVGVVHGSCAGSAGHNLLIKTRCGRSHLGEVWAGRVGLPVIDGSCAVKLWVVHKASSMVFRSVAWDQGGQHVVIAFAGDLAILIHEAAAVVAVVAAGGQSSGSVGVVMISMIWLYKDGVTALAIVLSRFSARGRADFRWEGEIVMCRLN
ncbi:hypothetical protein GUJ93_ZPchr0002g23012 [Zizania palustris]|uniref:Uncharacterized protein n=1 Tax=Zizania palustris TaxID=103762 RepID=A0A8J5SCV6_ZIZPA|nr:hypothetical protein GUJ93_ZPchr0002g23012 [Zizania palustris]